MELRREAIDLLFIHGDPNAYLDLAIELSSEESTPLKQSNALRNCTPTFCASKLTTEKRKKLVRHCFRLLERVDNGKSGAGYFLVLHVGQFVGIGVGDQTYFPFGKDQPLPPYEPDKTPQGRMQTTVEYARKWWAANQDKY